MESEKTTFMGNFKKFVRNRLVTGLLVIVPIYVTFVIIKFLFSFVGGILSPVVRKFLLFFGYSIPDHTSADFVITSLAFVLTFVLLYFIGFCAADVTGRLLIGYLDKLMQKMPFIKNIYTSSKQLINLVSLPSRKAFKRVVIVDYPRIGLKSFAFVTGSIKSNDGTELTSIFIPTTPNPTSGFLIYLPESEITETNMTIEEGMKLIFSGGILAPEEIEFGHKKIASDLG